MVLTSTAFRQISQDSMALPQGEHLTSDSVDLLHRRDLLCGIDRDIGLFHVLSLAHGDELDLMVDSIQLAEAGDGTSWLTAEVDVEDEFEIGRVSTQSGDHNIFY